MPEGDDGDGDDDDNTCRCADPRRATLWTTRSSLKVRFSFRIYFELIIVDLWGGEGSLGVDKPSTDPPDASRKNYFFSKC